MAVKRWRQMWLRKTAPGVGGCKQGLKRPCTEILTLHNADPRLPAITDRKPRNAYLLTRSGAAKQTDYDPPRL